MNGSFNKLLLFLGGGTCEGFLDLQNTGKIIILSRHAAVFFIAFGKRLETLVCT